MWPAPRAHCCFYAQSGQLPYALQSLAEILEPAQELLPPGQADLAPGDREDAVQQTAGMQPRELQALAAHAGKLVCARLVLCVCCC